MMIFLCRTSTEPFFSVARAPAGVVEPAAAKTTGKENEKAGGVRFKGASPLGARLRGRVILEDGTVECRRFEPGQRRRHGIPVPHCSGQAAHLYPVRYATGNSNPAHTHAHHFDTIYPTAHDRLESLTCSAGRTLSRAGGSHC